MSAEQLTAAVHDNLRNLGREMLDVVNLRVMGGEDHGPGEGSIEAPLTALAELQQRGLIRHLGLSNVTASQVDEGRRIATIVCAQNHYNLAHRVAELAGEGVAFVPFFRSAASRPCSRLP